jgi:hypothetical protein
MLTHHADCHYGALNRLIRLRFQFEFGGLEFFLVRRPDCLPNRYSIRFQNHRLQLVPLPVLQPHPRAIHLPNRTVPQAPPGCWSQVPYVSYLHLRFGLLPRKELKQRGFPSPRWDTRRFLLAQVLQLIFAPWERYPLAVVSAARCEALQEHPRRILASRYRGSKAYLSRLRSSRHPGWHKQAGTPLCHKRSRWQTASIAHSRQTSLTYKAPRR